MKSILIVLAGYLIGSVSFSIIVFWLIKREDIRKYGSGNAGMTNVLRIAGKGPAAMVLAGDALKGVISVYIGFSFGNPTLALLTGLAAMVGHTYPIYFGFKGGKGVATGLGVILALTPDVTAVALAVFILSLLISRYVSLSSILGAASVPVSMIILQKPLSVLAMGILAVSLVIYRHRTNIKRLYNGTEQKIGQR